MGSFVSPSDIILAHEEKATTTCNPWEASHQPAWPSGCVQNLDEQIFPETIHVISAEICLLLSLIDRASVFVV